MRKMKHHMQIQGKRSLAVAQPIVMALIGLSSFLVPFSNRGMAQAAALPNCQPPHAAEFLLLVVTPTPEKQAQLQRVLPAEVDGVACNYLGDRVTRIGGFPDQEAATAWGRYISQTTKLSSFVARPSNQTTNQASAALPPNARPSSQTPNQASATPPPSARQPGQVPNQASATPPPTARPSAATSKPSPVVSSTNAPAATKPTTQPQVQPTATARSRPPSVATASPRQTPTAQYQPQVLGSGYAILVDYFDRPDLVAQLQRSLGQRVGLVVFNQRPFALAMLTPNEQTANAVFRKLTEQGYLTMVVDGRSVVLLTPAVASQ